MKECLFCKWKEEKEHVLENPRGGVRGVIPQKQNY